MFICDSKLHLPFYFRSSRGFAGLASIFSLNWGIICIVADRRLHICDYWHAQPTVNFDQTFFRTSYDSYLWWIYVATHESRVLLLWKWLALGSLSEFISLVWSYDLCSCLYLGRPLSSHHTMSQHSVLENSFVMHETSFYFQSHVNSPKSLMSQFQALSSIFYTNL